MSETVLITSAKGGVGKSTVACMLGLAFAQNGRNVLILELDSGLRGLDVMLPDIKPIVYDMGDVLSLRCKPAQAINIVKTEQGNLHFMSAPADRHFEISQNSLEILLRGLESCYDFLILDCAAGLGKCFDVASRVAQTAVLVTCCDIVSARDASIASGLLEGMKKRLVINKFRYAQLGEDFNNLDEVVDLTHVRLAGVIPFDSNVKGALVKTDSNAYFEACDIALRLMEEDIPLNTKRLIKA